MKFGPGCFDFEVDQFKPICSHPVLPGSEPATFDVPLPSLVHPVPPTECVCFDFKSEEVAVTTVSCNTVAKCSVTIEKLDPDCCTGRYKVTPNIEVPCIPFDIASAVVTTSVSSGATGKASFRIEKNCNNCSIKPYLDIVFPNPQIVVPTPCFRVQGDNSFAQSASAAAKVGKVVRSLVSAAAKGRKALRALAATSPDPFRVRAKYKDDSGEDKYAYGTFTVSEDSASGCDVFRIGSADLDLTGIGGGFSNGGDVNALTISGKKVLAIDGGLYNDVPIYGGGLGNLTYDDPDKMYCRGNIMRYSSHPSGYANTPVPMASISQQRLVRKDNTYEIAWKASTRKADGSYQAGTGALDMYIPSAVQWHTPASEKPIRGVALVFSNFIFNSAGTLAEEYEGTGAAIIAPGIAVDSSDTNKSGLVVDSAGLAVKYGPGFKIKGSGTTDLDSPSTDAGTLLPNVGVGLQVHGQTYAVTTREDNQLEPRISQYEFGFSSGGEICMDDHAMGYTDVIGWDYTDWHRRNDVSELLIPIIIPSSEDDTVLNRSTGVTRIKTGVTLPDCKVVFLRISNSGLSLAAATNKNDANYTRGYTPPRPS